MEKRRRVAIGYGAAQMAPIAEGGVAAAMLADEALTHHRPDCIDQYHRLLESVDRGVARTILAAEQPSVIELTGQIKWFDVAKGYGFIAPDNGLPDILLHITCLHRDGYRVALEGARVVVAVVQSERGLQAVHILSMDTSTAKHAAETAPARTHVVINATGPFERAQVRWFNRVRGFGFLTCGEGTPDIFVHMETLRRFGLTELNPGEWVWVRFGNGPKGLMAAEVRPEEAPLGPASH
jgi:CspA family cold shock protein